MRKNDIERLKAVKQFVDFARSEVKNGVNVDKLLGELRTAITEVETERDMFGNPRENGKDEIKTNDIFFSVLKQNEAFYDRIARQRRR